MEVLSRVPDAVVERTSHPGAGILLVVLVLISCISRLQEFGDSLILPRRYDPTSALEDLHQCPCGYSAVTRGRWLRLESDPSRWRAIQVKTDAQQTAPNPVRSSVGGCLNQPPRAHARTFWLQCTGVAMVLMLNVPQQC